MAEKLSYCGETVRKHDPDRFLLSLFAPAAVRADLWALYAFNYEIAKTREVVTDTHLGLIRLQWWRDALAAVYDRGTVPAHQIVTPLAGAIRRHDLPRDLFDNLIYAREFDLEDRLPSNLEGMAKYAEFTAAPLLHLAQKISGENMAHDGVAAAYALAGILRATPALLRQRRCYLPEDMLAAAGIDIYGLYEGEGVDRLPPVVEKIVVEARRLLASSDAAMQKTARRHAKLAEMYLRQIEKSGYDVFAPRLQAPPFLKEIRLLFS